VDTNFIEAIGYCGTLATVATYSMRSIAPLRIAGIASSLFFITYGAIMGVWPMLLTEFVILPINCLRLVQVLRAEPARRHVRHVSRRARRRVVLPSIASTQDLSASGAGQGRAGTDVRLATEADIESPGPPSGHKRLSNAEPRSALILAARPCVHHRGPFRSASAGLRFG
jgi:hypothetical protein